MTSAWIANATDVRLALVHRFWAKVDKRGPDECWPWTGAKSSHGYGNFCVEGRTEKASRFSWFLVHGAIEPGICICHHCDNPICVNPAHLFAGTRLDNTRDCQAKGRFVVYPRVPKTHCHRGHPLSGYNCIRVLDVRDGNTYRRCRECMNLLRRKKPARCAS